MDAQEIKARIQELNWVLGEVNQQNNNLLAIYIKARIDKLRALLVETLAGPI